MTPPTGFDRLRESGFTEEDIRNIRTQFHRLHGTSFDSVPTEEARNLEEQWMDNTGETLPDGSKLSRIFFFFYLFSKTTIFSFY